MFRVRSYIHKNVSFAKSSDDVSTSTLVMVSVGFLVARGGILQGKHDQEERYAQ